MFSGIGGLATGGVGGQVRRRERGSFRPLRRPRFTSRSDVVDERGITDDRGVVDDRAEQAAVSFPRKLFAAVFVGPAGGRNGKVTRTTSSYR